MSGILRRAVIAAAFVVAFAAPLAQSVAGPLAALGNAPGGSIADAGLLQRVHGFHCRKELGWDPRTGTYRQHRHEGICRDYQGCLREQYRCNLIMGRGWDTWSYERWGWDNWRFNACMLRAGCY